MSDDLKETLCGMIVVLENKSEHMYTDKMGRWVGFIQGVLFSNGLLFVEDEREKTRPIMHEAYKKAGLPRPESLSIYQY